MKARAVEPITPARIERALALCAYLVTRDEEGLELVPIMDRLEAELGRARAEEDPRYRARRLLNAYTAPGAAHALR
jgi:hypothetical protein